MTNYVTLGIAFLALVLGGVAVLNNSDVPLGGTTEFAKKSFVEGLYAGQGRAVELDRSGNVVLDKAGFCIDFYATSTATRVHMTASSTATIEGTDNVMMFEYGSCQ